MNIIPYSQSYFKPLITFLRKNWAPEHSIYDRQLFDWQYGGVGDDTGSCMLLLDSDDTVIGFIGVIKYPFIYRGNIKNSSGLALWVVDESVRNTGAGIYLLKEVEDSSDVIFCICMNASVIHYYKSLNYSYHDNLHRYVIPLEANGYKSFLEAATEDIAGQNVSQARRARNDDDALVRWIDSIDVRTDSSSAFSYAEAVTNIDPEVLACTYRENVAPYFELLPQKDADFWQWRYLDSKGFSYSFFRGEGGIIIFRVEEVHAPGDALRHGAKCLRIIEIIPKSGKVWNGDTDSDLAGLLSSLLVCAKQQGCVLADFQISTSRLGHIMEGAGFRLQQADGITNITRLFAPYKPGVKPLNFVYKVSDNGKFADIDRDDVYLLKSDVDMDRPNYLKREQ